jgi:hypothetical protein
VLNREAKVAAPAREGVPDLGRDEISRKGASLASIDWSQLVVEARTSIPATAVASVPIRVGALMKTEAAVALGTANSMVKPASQMAPP